MEKLVIASILMLIVGCATSDQQQGFDDFANEQNESQGEEFSNQDNNSNEDNLAEGNADIQSINESSEYEDQVNASTNLEDESDLAAFEDVNQNSVLDDDPTANLNNETEGFLSNDETPIQEVSGTNNAIEQDSYDNSNNLSNNGVNLPAPLSVPDLSGEDISEVAESLSTLWWVGQWYNKERKSVSIEMTTRGAPEYQVFQEMNKQNQPELVVRFLKTSLRSRMRRDLDANEFHSPVSYIRMRQNTDSNWTDIVLTFRDEVQTSLYAKDGNIVVSVPISKKYLGSSVAELVPAEQAIRLQNANVIPTIESGSESPSSEAPISSLDRKIKGALKSQIQVSGMNSSDSNVLDDEQALDDTNSGAKLDAGDIDSLGDDSVSYTHLTLPTIYSV